mgnify:CR=1 FL=1
MSGRRGVDLRVIALPWRARVLWITLACLAAVLAALTFGIVAGSSRLGVADVWTTLLGAGSRTYQFIVFELRLPRVAAGIGVGLCLGLAGALLGDPRYLIFDEPLNGLDPEGIRWMRTLMRRFADEGRGVLVADGAHHARRAVPAVVVVEPVAPVQHNGPSGAGVGELVSRQHLPLQGGEERLGRGIDAPIDRQVDQAAISSSPLTGLAMASGAGSRRKSSRARYRFRHRMISRFDMPSAVRRAT